MNFQFAQTEDGTEMMNGYCHSGRIPKTSGSFIAQSTVTDIATTAGTATRIVAVLTYYMIYGEADCSKHQEKQEYALEIHKKIKN